MFKCFRCGYEHDVLNLFKKHLERKTECKPKQSDISLMDVKQKYYKEWQAISSTESPKTRRKRKVKLRQFGDEVRDYLKKEMLNEYILDPLKGIQSIIKDIYFNNDHEENHTIRTHPTEGNSVEIYMNDSWTRANKQKTYDKMIYRAADILENNTTKKNWTSEFKNFIGGMGEIDNDELLQHIREEVEDTVCNAEREMNSINEDLMGTSA